VIRRLYSILDLVANSIVGGVHVHGHDAPAIRMFGDIAAAEGTSIHQHLPDYDLLLIGELDDETGQITPCEPVVVLSGAALKATWEQQAAREVTANA